MWKLELDIPYSFQVRPGFQKAQHALDFQPLSYQNCWLEKRHGILMLLPSTFTDNWRQNLIPLDSIQRQQAFWQQAARAGKQSAASFLAKAVPTGSPANLIELLINIAIVAITANMKWVAATTINLEPDEGFTFYIQGADDEYDRADDFFYLQWDRFGFQADSRGMASLWRYGLDLSQPPRKIGEYRYSDGNPVREASAFSFIPCPPWGLLVLYSVRSTGTMMQSQSSAGRLIASSHLFDLSEYAQYNQGIWSLTQASPLRIGINIRYDPIIAIERIRYPEAGEFIDKPFAVGYTSLQASSTPIVLYSRNQQAASSLLKPDASGPWNGEPGACVKLQLGTTDAKYSPFVVGYFAQWQPEYAMRNTNPQEVRLVNIEYTWDDRGRDEGVAEIIADSSDPAFPIIQRGDATFRLSYQSGAQWIPVAEGFAATTKIEDAKYGYRPRWIRAELKLQGYWARLAEAYLHSETAFDGILYPDAINRLLDGCGFPPIPSSEFPPALQGLRIPSASSGGGSSGWRYAPRLGQSGLEILRSLLLLANTTTAEYRLRYDLALGRFTFERKASARFYELYPYKQSFGPIYSSLEMVPAPPEANIIWVEGATRPDTEGERIAKVLVHSASLNNPASPHYLGRAKLLRITADSLSTEADVARVADLLYQVAAFRQVEATIKCPDVVPALIGAAALPADAQIMDENGALILEGYIRRATITASTRSARRGLGEMTLWISTQFFSDPRDL